MGETAMKPNLRTLAGERVIESGSHLFCGHVELRGRRRVAQGGAGSLINRGGWGLATVLGIRNYKHGEWCGTYDM